MTNEEILKKIPEQLPIAREILLSALEEAREDERKRIIEESQKSVKIKQ